MKVAALAGLSFGMFAGASASPAQPQTTSVMKTIHTRNCFEFTVHAPYAITAPLFGPNGERAWAKGDWDPKFLYPESGEDVEGAVFTIQHGTHRSIWVNTQFDLQRRHFQYVYFLPDIMVVKVEVHFLPLDPENTQVNVSYERTSLTVEANDHVRELGERDRNSGPQWQEAIDHYLRSKTGR